MKEETKDWLNQAERDLKTSQHALENKDYYASAFWCQQTLEKAFKALLIEKTSEFPKIHDLKKLAEMNNTQKR